MMQHVEMTREEKAEMYNKLSKREIIELLLNNEQLINQLTQPIQPYPTYPTSPDWNQPYYITKTTCDA